MQKVDLDVLKYQNFFVLEKQNQGSSSSKRVFKVRHKEILMSYLDILASSGIDNDYDDDDDGDDDGFSSSRYGAM